MPKLKQFLILATRFERDQNIHNENVTYFSLSYKRRKKLYPLTKPAFHTDQPILNNFYETVCRYFHYFFNVTVVIHWVSECIDI